MQVCCISDLHGNLIPVPECDLLLIGGDVCPYLKHDAELQSHWIVEKFQPWLINQGRRAKHVVGIAGNHDIWAAHNEQLARDLAWTYLLNEATVVEGVTIWGSPMAMRFGPFPFMGKEIDLAAIWETIPADVQILMTHGPCYGMRDFVNNPYGPDPHVGSVTLRNRIAYGHFPELQVHVSGHIHEAWGHEAVDGVNYVNPSYVNERMQPENPMIAFDFPLSKVITIPL